MFGSVEGAQWTGFSLHLQFFQLMRKGPANWRSHPVTDRQNFPDLAGGRDQLGRRGRHRQKRLGHRNAREANLEHRVYVYEISFL